MALERRPGKGSRKPYANRRRRGNCSVCGFRHDMRKDGMVSQHKVYIGNEGRVCEGSGKPDRYAAVNREARERYGLSVSGWMACESYSVRAGMHWSGVLIHPFRTMDEFCAHHHPTKGEAEACASIEYGLRKQGSRQWLIGATSELKSDRAPQDWSVQS